MTKFTIWNERLEACVTQLQKNGRTYQADVLTEELNRLDADYARQREAFVTLYESVPLTCRDADPVLWDAHLAARDALATEQTSNARGDK